MGDRQEWPSAVSLCPVVSVDPNLWLTVYIAADTDVKWILKKPLYIMLWYVLSALFLCQPTAAPVALASILHNSKQIQL